MQVWVIEIGAVQNRTCYHMYQLCRLQPIFMNDKYKILSLQEILPTEVIINDAYAKGRSRSIQQE